MSKSTTAYWALVGLFALALFVHVQFLGGGLRNLAIEDEFSYDQSLEITGSLGEANLVMYVPEARPGLEIRDEKFETADLDLELRNEDGGRQLSLRGQQGGAGRHIRYLAQLKSLALTYTLDPHQKWDPAVPADSTWLQATATIQAGHDDIANLLLRIFELAPTDDATAWTPAQWQQTLSTVGVGPVQALETIFAYADQGIASATFSGTTDALTALRLSESSCGGKSRLMVALCRRVGLPSRVVGGVIMGQTTRKRAHHLWVETRLGNSWVPCDPLNHHFAFKPAYFLTLYTGDLSLIRHSRGMTFDYGFSSERRRVPLIWLNGAQGLAGAGASGVIPMLDRRNFSAIMLAPFGLLLIVFARQVVGLESIGTFLPILLGYSLIQADWMITLGQMALAILLGVGLRFLLNRLNLLHVPRSAVMITFVVLVFLAFSAGMSRFDTFAGVGTIVLPLAALAMAVEKFTIVAMDKGTGDALKLLGQTLLLALGCRLIMTTPFFRNLTIAFPEVLLLVIAMIILLGNFRGLRWKEYWRFRQVRDGGAS